MSTKQVNELSIADLAPTPSAEIPAAPAYAPEADYADQAAMVMSAGGESSGSIAIGDPVSEVPARNVSVYASSITPVSYDEKDNIACFDVVLSVGISCSDSSGQYQSKTYQVVKRIGIDKTKIAAEAESSAPVSIVEDTTKVEKPVVVEEKKPLISEAKRFRRLAGLE